MAGLAAFELHGIHRFILLFWVKGTQDVTVGWERPLPWVHTQSLATLQRHLGHAASPTGPGMGAAGARASGGPRQGSLDTAGWGLSVWKEDRKPVLLRAVHS